MTRNATSPAALKPLAVGTKIATIGTFYDAEIVTSEVNERGVRISTIRWADNTPGINAATRISTWAQVPGRTPRFVVLADQS